MFARQPVYPSIAIETNAIDSHASGASTAGIADVISTAKNVTDALRATVTRHAAPQQRARHPAAQNIAEPRHHERNPRVDSDLRQIEPARVLQIFREPENVEVPHRIHEDLRKRERPARSACATVPAPGPAYPRARRAAPSACDTCVNQNTSQSSPARPTNANAACHPTRRIRYATIGGARIAPTDDPLLNSPAASARSFSGNHSATTFTAPGQFPASPIPSRNRNTPETERAARERVQRRRDATTTPRTGRSPTASPAGRSSARRGRS